MTNTNKSLTIHICSLSKFEVKIKSTQEDLVKTYVFTEESINTLLEGLRIVLEKELG